MMGSPDGRDAPGGAYIPLLPVAPAGLTPEVMVLGNAMSDGYLASVRRLI